MKSLNKNNIVSFRVGQREIEFIEYIMKELNMTMSHAIRFSIGLTYTALNKYLEKKEK